VRHIIEAFSILLILVINLLLCIGLLGASADVAAAKKYQEDVIAEIENSNFNPNVIEGCREQAALHGYILDVSPSLYDADHDSRIARVSLTYRYEIPLLGVQEKRLIHGIAR